MEFNKYQTELTDVLLSQLSGELKEELFALIDSIPFIYNMISADRPEIEDVPKDDDGKLIVDIMNPHILKDMDYFRQPAIYYQKYHTYTKLIPSTNVNSEYRRFWKEEADKCRGIVVREDGEWIPGDYYFYLNYSPILLNRVVEGTKRPRRVRDFPDAYDGDYLYFHYFYQARVKGKHVNQLKKRGAGGSFKAASGLALSFILGDGDYAREENKTFVFAYDKEYLIKDGILNKFVDNADWCSENTPWPRIRDLKDSLNGMHWIMGYKESDSSAAMGTKNEVIGVTLQGDLDHGRGKRGSRVYWEEAGMNKYLQRAWNIARSSVEQDGYAYGTLISYGTGGTDNKDLSGMLDLYYSPDGYNILSLPNLYDRNAAPGSLSGFFFGDYMDKLDYYDRDGNSDVIGSLIAILEERIKIKYNTINPNALIQIIAEHPITPQESLMRTVNNIFPILEIKDYMADVLQDYQKFIAPHYVGHLVETGGGGVAWKNDLNVLPIREFPLKDTGRAAGAIEIFEMPHTDTDGNVPYGRYIAGIDPIDYDALYDQNSLGSIFIFDLWTDRIVAEYTGRPRFADDFYETCRRLLIFYNAVANYENNLKGLFVYFNNHGALPYLCDTPQILIDREYVKERGYGNRALGTHVVAAINAMALKLQADWLLKPAYNPFPADEGEEVIEVDNLHKVRSIGYLRELLAWGPTVNCDRVSAMDMVMIMRENELRYVELRRERKAEDIYDDPWFKRSGVFHHGELKKKIMMNDIGPFSLEQKTEKGNNML